MSKRFISPEWPQSSPVLVLVKKTDTDNVMKRGCASARLHNEGHSQHPHMPFPRSKSCQFLLYCVINIITNGPKQDRVNKNYNSIKKKKKVQTKV